MEVDYHYVVDTIVLLLTTVVGGYVKSVKAEAKETKDKLNGLELKVAEEYVSYTTYQSTMGDIKDSLRRIEDKLDGKADKHFA